MICTKHDKLKEIFCRADQCCICYLCMLDEHKNHDTVSAGAERTEKQTQLGEIQRKFQKRIQERKKELEELRETVDTYKQVLCRESVCGRSYWEVEWSGRVEITVSYKSISRKGHDDDDDDDEDKNEDHEEDDTNYDTCEFGRNDQSWCLFCSDSSYSFWHHNKGIKLPEVSSSSRIGVKCFSSEKSKLNCCRTVAEVSLPVSVYSKMAESSVSLAQNQFNCSICLNKLTDPVTIPCGHSYCKSCITGCWDQDDQKGVYSCPQCRQTFTPRPVLGKNTMLVKVEDNPRKRKIQAAQLDHCYGELGDVECDVCTGSKNKAIKSCLVCLNSYCQTHFERHEEFHPGKRHKVTNATKRLQEMICPQHDKLLEIFCRTDQHCICYLCMLDEHKNHDHVSAAAERTEKQRSAQTAVEDSERIFTELIRSIERSRSEVTRLIRDQEKAAVSRAEVLLEQLKKEIEDLKRRDAEVDKLSHTDLHIHFLQSFQSLSVPPGSTDSPTITYSSHCTFDDVEKSVSHLREKLEHFCREEIQNIHNKEGEETVEGTAELKKETGM
ncbi:hypothetical protein cypCar_00008226 [Cyprinus carpio]|nr:hypothetical protein cypCar_00008226 [Cyprinus carpio]